MAKINTIRVLLSIVANFNWPLQQYNVKNAFLHGDLREEVYMPMLSGNNAPNDANVVCKLKKALYGLKKTLYRLKQSSRAWSRRFRLAMKKIWL